MFETSNMNEKETPITSRFDSGLVKKISTPNSSQSDPQSSEEINISLDMKDSPIGAFKIP